MNHRLTRWSPAAILVIAGSTHSLAAGPFGAVFELSSLNGANGFVINGIDAFDRSGWSVSSAGDVNGDGFSDLIIGAYRADPNGLDSGESYVVFGGVGIGASGTLNLSTLNGTNGFVINGVDAYDRSGASVSSAGDVNGDGFDDLIIGARLADPNGYDRAGESYVVFGRVDCPGDLNIDNVIDTADLGNMIGQFNTTGPDADINGDGVVDTADLGILIGRFGGDHPYSDINNDGIVDTADLGILIGQFGQACP